MKTETRWQFAAMVAMATVGVGGCPAKTEAPHREYRETEARPAAVSEGIRVLRAVLRPLPEAAAGDPRKVLLGRRLFHEGRLSRDGTVSCSSCHLIDRGGTDQRVSSLGIAGQVGPINSPTVFNSRYNFVQFWDGRAADLRAQAAGQVTNPREMGNTWPNVVATLGRDATYATAFREAYTDGLTEANVRDALAVYEETLVTPSRGDRFLRGDDRVLSADERAGAEAFGSEGCTTCHNGVNLGGTSFQKMGAIRDYFAERGTPLTEADNGRFNVTHQESDRRFFKVPTLRNLSSSAPYFHDGHARTLEVAVRTMGAVQLGRDLGAQQVAQIVAFLRAFDGEVPAAARMP